MMRILLALFFAVLFSASLLAQEIAPGVQLKSGYLGHVAIQPGINIGIQFPLTTIALFEKKANSKFLVLTPSIGIFSRPDISTNLLINTYLGVYSLKKKKRHSISSIGLGYLFESKVESFSVNLGTGSRSASQKKENHFFVPSLGQEFGWILSDKLRLYNQYMLGYKLSGNSTNAAVFFAELGITFLLK